MKNKNIEFVGDIRFNNSSRKKKVEALISKFLNDKESEFDNFFITEDNKYLIPVIRDYNWKHGKSLFINFEEVSSMYLNRYIRISESNELRYGLSFYNKSYVEFFISDEYYDKHSDLMERKLLNWLDEKESFVNSLYVNKYKYLSKHLYWSGGNKCFPDNLYIEFKANYKMEYKLIKKFYSIDCDLKVLDNFFKTNT